MLEVGGDVVQRIAEQPSDVEVPPLTGAYKRQPEEIGQDDGVIMILPAEEDGVEVVWATVVLQSIDTTLSADIQHPIDIFLIVAVWI